MNKLSSNSLCSSILGIQADARASTALWSRNFVTSRRSTAPQHLIRLSDTALAVNRRGLIRSALQPPSRWTAILSPAPSGLSHDLFYVLHQSSRQIRQFSRPSSSFLYRSVFGSAHAVAGTDERFIHTSNYFQNEDAKGHPPTQNAGQGVGGESLMSNPPERGSEPSAFVHKRIANKNLMERLPQMPHRPSREELLAAATGFWSRLKVRFKWFSIRSARPFNADEIGAFFSWVVLGHVLWIILGTTTFFSLGIFAINTVFAQETLARWVGNYLTRSSGIKVVFESAIVPKWGDGVITFKNVFVSRRPGHGKGWVSKGSPSTEAAVAAAAMKATTESEEVEEDSNYTQFDLSLDTVNVTLSFNKWFNSKGLLRDVEIRGVRGVIDRTSLHNADDDADPRSYKHEHNPGDFEVDSFKMSDLLVTVHQPDNFRPFEVSVFNCDLPQLRRQWLFYDFLSANQMSGHIDNSMFNLHPRQDHSYAGNSSSFETETHGSERSPWKKSSRLRIDALNIDHLNRGVGGPFGWIHQGNVDIVADIMFPADNDESIGKLMSDFYDRLEATVTSTKTNQTEEPPTVLSHGQNNSAKGWVSSPVAETIEDDKRFLIMDLKVHLNDIRAAVPLFNKELSYVNNALVRPIVAYMNSRHTFIPIHCRVIKRVSEFDGSWTIFDSGLMDDISAETYTAFAKDVTDDQARIRRFRKVGLWSLQIAIQAFFMGLAGTYA